MSKTFKSVEHAIRWSEQHSSPALLTADSIRSVIDDAEALGYSVGYSDLDTDLDLEADYDVWGTTNPESEGMDWRLNVKLELQDDAAQNYQD